MQTDLFPDYRAACKVSRFSSSCFLLNPLLATKRNNYKEKKHDIDSAHRPKINLYSYRPIH